MLAFSTDAEALSLPTPTEWAGHEQDSRGHSDWNEMIRLASDCRLLLHPVLEGTEQERLIGYSPRRRLSFSSNSATRAFSSAYVRR